MEPTRTLEYQVVDRVATITLSRPDRLNAWTGRMHTEYRAAVAAAEADPEVRVLVVTGAGRGFCAGADARALDGHVAKGGYDDGLRGELATPGYGVRSEFDHHFAFHYGLRLPVLAAINGLYLLSTVRDCRDSLALNAIFEQNWNQVGQALEVQVKRNLDLFRANPADKIAA